jgi:hypothetical protein
MQLGWIYLYDNKQAKQDIQQVKTIRIEVTKSGAHGDKDVIPVVPSFLGEVRLHWRGMVATKA